MENQFSNWYNIIDANIQPIKHIFNQNYPGSGVVLDVGGNAGAFTDYVISQYPTTEVHIFEPVEKFKEYLTKKYNNITNVKFVPKGLSNTESTAYIKCDGDNLGCNEISDNGDEEILLTTLDNYIKTEVKDKISFIKIDVEFYEPFVIDGMREYIESTQDLPIIVIEHNYSLSPYKDIQDKVFEWLFNYYESFDYKSYYYTKDIVLIPKNKIINKLPISIGILSWHSGQTLIDTLFSYYQNGLFEITNDITILFQEVTDEDKQIANHFSLPYIGLDENIGIGKAFIELTKNAQTENILLLEHDWLLIENKEITYSRLKSGLDLINSGFNSVKYRHRNQPGYPLFTQAPYQGNELNHYDKEMDLISPHLLESIHWLPNPDELFPDKIQKQNDHFITTSRWGNWTNNPCMFKKQFYLDTVSQFAGGGIDLEGKISGWWARQDYKVAHGKGLFMHRDIQKFGR